MTQMQFKAAAPCVWHCWWCCSEEPSKHHPHYLPHSDQPVHQPAAQLSALSSYPTRSPLPPDLTNSHQHSSQRTHAKRRGPPPPDLTNSRQPGRQHSPAESPGWVMRRAAGVHHLHHLPGRAGAPDCNERAQGQLGAAVPGHLRHERGRMLRAHVHHPGAHSGDDTLPITTKPFQPFAVFPVT